MATNHIIIYLVMGVIFMSTASLIMWKLFGFSLRFKFMMVICATTGVVFACGAYVFYTDFSVWRLIAVGVIIGLSSHLAMIQFLKLVLNPLKLIAAYLEQLSKGDFSLETIEVKTQDEIGQICGRMNIMIIDVAGLISSIKMSTIENLAMADKLSGISSEMSDNSMSASSKADSVAAEAKETTSNMVIIASTMEQASKNIDIIATAVEENTIALDEVAKNSTKAGAASDEAVAQTKTASSKVKELGSAADAISKVTETITEISEQTNLLALNATIEAARAGETGKGFAVVAGEIKELARQTADATQEIKGMIEGVQQTSAGTIYEIEQISRVIFNSNDIVASIVTAVEEQSIATAEIATNVGQASNGIQEVAKNVNRSLSSLERITDGIAEVNQDTGSISKHSSLVKINAEELAGLAAQIQDNVTNFTTNLDKAA